MLNHSSATPHTIKSTKTRKLGSATERRETHVTKATKNKTLNLNGGSKKTISNAVKRRAQAIIEDRSIDAQSRAIIRYGLEINDLWLPELVRRIEAGETIIDLAGRLIRNTVDYSNTLSRRRRVKGREVCR